ncbi:MAG: hypothetical protein U0610_29800 [bacterium]
MSAHPSVALDHIVHATSCDALARSLLAIDMAPFRYLRRLLITARSRALDGRRPVEILRGERIAAGIDHPELDVSTVWACRGSDENVGIPFLELILDELLSRAAAAQEACAAAAPRRAQAVHGVVVEIAGLREELARRVAGGGRRAEPLTFVDASVLEGICGPAGTLALLVSEVQQMRAEALASIRDWQRACQASARMPCRPGSSPAPRS